MAYRDYNPAGLEALSPTVTAYKQFVQRTQNVPDNQIVPFLISQGKPELAGLIANKMYVDGASKQQQTLMQQPPAAPPTVSDKYAAQAAATRMGESAQPQAAAPMSSGIAQLPNPAMDRGFAHGGIVAFQQGGPPDRLQSMVNDPSIVPDMSDVPGYEAYVSGRWPGWARMSDREKQQVAKTFSDIYQRKRAEKIAFLAPIKAGEDTRERTELAYSMMRDANKETAPVATPAATPTVTPADSARTARVTNEVSAAAPGATPADRPRAGTPRRDDARARPSAEDPYAKFLPSKPPTVEEAMREQLAREMAGGYGRGSKAAADEKAFIEERKQRTGESEKTARKDFWVMLGASLLGNRSPYFATALGESVKENYGNLIKDLRDLKKEQDSVRQLEIQFRRAEENAAQTGDERAVARAETLGERYRTAQFEIQKHKDSVRNAVLDREVRLQIARLQQQGNEGKSARLMALWEGVNEPGISPEVKAKREAALKAEFKFVTDLTAATTGTVLAANISAQARQDEDLRALRASSRYQLATPEERQQMEAGLLRGAGVATAGAQGVASGPGLPPGFELDK